MGVMQLKAVAAFVVHVTTSIRGKGYEVDEMTGQHLQDLFCLMRPASYFLEPAHSEGDNGWYV
jgi:hypothetical protein